MSSRPPVHPHGFAPNDPVRLRGGDEIGTVVGVSRTTISVLVRGERRRNQDPADWAPAFTVVEPTAVLVPDRLPVLSDRVLAFLLDAAIERDAVLSALGVKYDDRETLTLVQAEVGMYIEVKAAMERVRGRAA